MNRLISLFISISLIISAIPVFAQEDLGANPEKVGEAAAILTAVSDNEIFKEINTQNVTRAEYISAVVGLLGGNYGQKAGSVFKDVGEGASYASDVYRALEMGLISESPTFRPDDTITFNEAVKVAVSALNLTRLAEAQGGYPSGYAEVAKEHDLLLNIKITNTLTRDYMAILLFNMLKSELLSLDYTTASKVQYEYKGQTLLYNIYGIKITEGLVTQTQIASYNPEFSYSKKNESVAIDGNLYNTKVNINDFFGMNCTVFYEEEENAVVAVYPVDNEELVLDLEYVSEFDGTRLVYQPDGEGKKTYRVEASYTEVYNKKVKTPKTEDITALSGILRMVDNDDDGTYDVIFVDRYTYSKVKNISISDRLIEDEHNSDNNISINEESVFYSIKDTDGNELKAGDIVAGDVLEVIKSEDGSFAEITVLKNPISSEITAFLPQSNELLINGTEYKVSDYARTYCGDRFIAGTGLEVYIGHNNEIAYAYFTDAGYKYGYITGLATEGGFEYILKMFTTASKFENFMLADKLMLDSVSGQSNESVYNRLQSGFVPQLVRYKLNKDGLVSSIDTAEVCTVDDSISVDEWEREPEEDNKLTRYVYPETSFMFRSNYCFGTRFNAVGATVMLVPVINNSETVDVSYKDGFEVVDISSIKTGFNYGHFDVYDINEYGTASILVSRKITNGSIHSFISTMKLKSNAGMISKVERAVNSEGDLGQRLEIWVNGTFKEYFLPETVECIMEQGTNLEKGDIVRFRADGEEIIEITLDFDYGSFGSNYAYNASSAQFNRGNTTLTYQVGKLYNFNEKFCYYSDKREGSEYDFSPVNMGNSQINASNICCFDPISKEIKTITVDELRSYKAYQNEADYIVIRQEGLVTQSVFAYRKGGN